MAQLQYQALAAPVLTTAQFPELVTESRWHEPWSEPVRFKMLPAMAVALAAASGLYADPVPLPALQASPDRYEQPWSMPRTLAKAGLAASEQQALAFVGFAPFPETVSEDRWHQPWSAPRSLAKPGLPPADQQVLALAEAAPFPESPTYPKWGFEWHPPVRIPPRLITGGQIEFVTTWVNPAAITFYPPLAEPVRVKPGLAASEQQAAIWTPTRTIPDITWDKWGIQWEGPVRIKPGLLASEQLALAIGLVPAPETVTESRWHEPWSEPLHPHPGVNAAWQQYQVSYVIVPLFPNANRLLPNVVQRARILTGEINQPA